MNVTQLLTRNAPEQAVRKSTQKNAREYFWAKENETPSNHNAPIAAISKRTTP